MKYMLALVIGFALTLHTAAIRQAVLRYRGGAALTPEEEFERLCVEHGIYSRVSAGTRTAFLQSAFDRVALPFHRFACTPRPAVCVDSIAPKPSLPASHCWQYRGRSAWWPSQRQEMSSCSHHGTRRCSPPASLASPPRCSWR